MTPELVRRNSTACGVMQGMNELRGGEGTDEVYGDGTDSCDGGAGNFDFANATCETITGIP